MAQSQLVTKLVFFPFFFFFLFLSFYYLSWKAKVLGSAKQFARWKMYEKKSNMTLIIICLTEKCEPGLSSFIKNVLFIYFVFSSQNEIP